MGVEGCQERWWERKAIRFRAEMFDVTREEELIIPEIPLNRNGTNGDNTHTFTKGTS